MNRNGSRQRVLDLFRADPYQPLKQLAERIGLSQASVSLHLCALERDGLIVRPKLVCDTSRQASAPSDRSQQWVAVKTGAIQRGEGAMRARKARGEDALQARINDVVKNAEKEGACFRADYLKLNRLGGCKCG